MGILHTNMLFITVYDCSLWSYDVIVTSTYRKSATIHFSLKRNVIKWQILSKMNRKIDNWKLTDT